jgi:hypothetical protein
VSFIRFGRPPPRGAGSVCGPLWHLSEGHGESFGVSGGRPRTGSFLRSGDRGGPREMAEQTGGWRDGAPGWTVAAHGVRVLEPAGGGERWRPTTAPDGRRRPIPSMDCRGLRLRPRRRRARRAGRPVGGVVVSGASGRRDVGRHRGRPRLALRHSVLIVPTPVGVEFHLDHRVSHGRGQHRVVGEAAFTAWIADAGDPSPSFRVGTACPCPRNTAASVHSEPPR